MKNKRLARWLQDHTTMLGSTDNLEDQGLHVAIYEGIIDIALSGDTRMIDSVLESAAAHAVATGRELTNLLIVHEQLRGRIWQRISDEIDPEPAFVMLSTVDEIFVHGVKVTIDAYLLATKLTHAAKSTEIARLYSESEKKVMQYATEVSRANRELARLDQAKTDFISIAAHELKTPLTLIQGYVNFLRDTTADSQVISLADGINRGAERMNNIIEDMLDLSAMDMKQLGLVLERVNLKTAIELVITQSQQAVRERNQTVTTIDLDTLPPIEADTRRLHQIFRQIISNAIKYTPDGGDIKIVGEALVDSPNSQDCIQITVDDTGVGIAPEDRDKIFEKFYRAGSSALHSTGQTKFMGAGPGLGLAIVKGLVNAHGGDVSAESPGFDTENFPGSTFKLRFPVQAAPHPDVHIQWMGQQDEDREPNGPASDADQTKGQNK